MRACAAMYRSRSGKGKKGKGLFAPGGGKGLYTPGASAHRGGRVKGRGKGLFTDLLKKGVKAIAPKAIDYLLQHGPPKLIKWIEGKSPAAAKLVAAAFEKGGPALAKLAHEKIEGLGLAHARRWLKTAHGKGVTHPRARKAMGGAAKRWTQAGRARGGGRLAGY